MEYLNKAFLLIGGNVGNKLSFLAQAVILLQKQCGDIIASSSIYETAPWGNTQQDSFLNQALELQTTFKADDLMVKLLVIEEEMGRVRQEKYGPRIIDLDILLFNDQIINTLSLTIPHKELQNRRFVLEPLSEIAPLLVHPVLGKSIRELLAVCKDVSEVRRIMVND